jgi:type IV secretion system protein VirB10
MPSAQNADPQPTLPSERTTKKPINSIRIATYALIGLAAIGLISNIGRLGSHVVTRVPKSAHNQKPGTISPDSVATFQEQEKEQVRKLQEENAQAAQALAQATQAAQNLHDQMPNMLPCTPALAGTQGTGPNGLPITCGSDGQWHPSSEASGIPPMSAAQRRALYGRQSAGSSMREDAAQTTKQRRLAALSSSSVAIDFTSNAGTDKPASIAPQQFAASASPIETITENRELADKEGPHPILVSDHPDAGKQPKSKYDWDRYTGKTYRIFEGTVLETVLTNRINGAFAGPIDTMVTTDLWSHDHQHLLIPQGTRCLGTVSAVSNANQQRLFVAFHRCIMPDGYSLDLDKFVGMNQIGATGLRDLVNHHYFQIFGASLAIGAVGGLAQIGNSTTTFGYDPSVSIRNGISQEMGQESMQILDRFLNQLPSFIVRERSRVRVYLSGDLEVPAYDAHQVDPTL